jgi:hypothetical protein
MTDTPRNVPPPPAGASYLVPLDQVERIERELREHDTAQRDSAWVLRVKQMSPDRQRIELFRLGDGTSGGVYEATANTATAQYRKVAGPGFAFVFGPVAFALNTVLWGAGLWVFRRSRRAAQLHAADGGRPL